MPAASLSHESLERSLPGPGREPPRATISFAYSGDPDDAFAFHGLESGAVALPGGASGRFAASHIQELNERALEETYDVTAISSAVYPRLAERYFISSAGASVGRGYGPMLASRRFDRIEELTGRRVASPGPLTTGNLLLRLTGLRAEIVYMPFDRIREAIAREDVAGGVLIHEELLNYREVGLRKVTCLGESWLERTGLPLPVGLNVIRRDLGRPLARSLARKLRESILHGLAHREAALAFARRRSIALADPLTLDFVDKFANQDTVRMDRPTRRALRVLLDAACEIDGRPKLPRLDIL